jgi:hypothetical protein
MADSDLNFWDPLTRDEVEFVRAIMAELRDVAWAKPMLARIEESGGMTHANKSKFFELRFASPV